MGIDALTAVAFAVGTAGNLVKGVPQFVTTALRGRVAGLSPTGAWLAVTANVVWLCFALAIGDVAVALATALGTVLTLGTAARLTAAQVRAARTGALVTVAATAGSAALAAAGEAGVLEVLGAGLGPVLSLPQLIRLLRGRRRGGDVRGVSGLEQGVVVTAQLGWTTYWLLTGHYIAALGAAWGGLSRALVGVLLVQRRRDVQPAG